MYRGNYTLIGQELSMFTRKLEAQLRYQNIPHCWQLRTNENSEAIRTRAGTRFIPALATPDGWVINDTISIGPLLNDRFCESPVIPSRPTQRSACFILEDFHNHWLARHALHSRWCYPANVVITGQRFGANLLLGKSIDDDLTDAEQATIKDFGEVMLTSFGAAACEVQGAGPDKATAIQTDFGRLIALFSEHFKQHNFLLGDRACLADFALVGPFKGHFLIDPEPRGWLGKQVSIFDDYVDRVWSGASVNAEWLEDDQLPATLLPILDYARRHYQAFAHQSIAAAGRGEKTFELDLGDGPFVARSMKRLNKARLHVQDELVKAGADKTVLNDLGVTQYYLATSQLD